MNTNIWAIVPAAGIGRRFGIELPKQYYELGAKPVIIRALQRLTGVDRISGIGVGLSPDEQIILTMTEIEGRTSPEISQLTGKAAGTIRVTLHRAKQKIAKNLKHLQELK